MQATLRSPTDGYVTTDNDHSEIDESILISGARELGIHLTADQSARFDRYQTELLDWNQRMNLTAITDPIGVQTRHFLDSLTVLVALPGISELDQVRRRIVDIGAGAGLPGIPLAIVLPLSKITLVEATQKKCRFLEHVIATLDLKNVDVACGRAEELAHRPDLRESFDTAVARALATLPTLVELGVPFLRRGGQLIAMKKRGIEDEIDAARTAITLVGGRLLPPVLVRVPHLDDARQLVIVEKVKPTSTYYPRRDGLPGKSPLSSADGLTTTKKGGPPARPR